jgi:hypothetical protein
MAGSFSFLENPFDDLDGSNLKEFDNHCKDIAENLINNYCIRIGIDKCFYLAEIEFYYWQKDKWNDSWNKVTYPRDNKKAGDLFYHNSGIDICFNSSYDEKKYGGILIRAIKDQNDVVTAGPLVCCQLILNSCDTEKMPILKRTDERHIEVKSSIRSLGKDDMIQEKERKNELKLCFYDSSIGINESTTYNENSIPEKNVWNPRKVVFDKKNGRTRIYKVQYASPKERLNP